MMISDLEHLELVSKEANSNQLKQVNGGGIAIAFGVFADAQGSKSAISLTRGYAVAISLAPSFTLG
jgi:hypothetical protein